MPIPGQVRPLFAAVLGAVAGGVLHRAVVDVTARGPNGWRVVKAPTRAYHAVVEGPLRQPGAWSLSRQETWFARTSLPGQRLRNIELGATLHNRGQLDIWLARHGIEAPAPGDLAVRLDRYQEQGVSAQVLTWSQDGAHRVSCSPSLPVTPGDSVELRAQASEGLLEVWIGGASSVCVVVSGNAPPALQAGHHRVRIDGLKMDGRPLRAPDPGPWWIWALGGAFFAVMVGRVEQATGASWWVQLLGDGLVLGSVALGLTAVQRFDGIQPSVLAGLLGAATLARLSIHVGRALRPVPGVGDWTRTAAIAAVLPTAGLLMIMEPSGEVQLPLEALCSGTFAAALAMVLALMRRQRPWRAIALMGALLSAATLLGRVVEHAAVFAVGTAALAGGGLSAIVGVLSRIDRPATWRALGAVAGLVALVCAMEVSTVQIAPIADPDQRRAAARHLSAPAAPLPAVPRGSIVFAGPLSPADHAPPRGLHDTLRRSIHRVGDDHWGIVELNQSLEMTDSQFHPDALVLTVGQRSDHVEVSAPLRDLVSRGVWFPGIAQLMRRLWTRPDDSVGVIARQMETLARALFERDVPLLVVLGASGPDPAAFDSWRAAIGQTQGPQVDISVFDMGEAAHADSELVWSDARGVLTDSGWTVVADHLDSLLK